MKTIKYYFWSRSADQRRSGYWSPITVADHSRSTRL